VAGRQRLLGLSRGSLGATGDTVSASPAQSGRGTVPRRSKGTRQLSTRCSSAALLDRRSFEVLASAAVAQFVAGKNVASDSAKAKTLARALFGGMTIRKSVRGRQTTGIIDGSAAPASRFLP
jgi:hypothetical protein